ncbi:SIS domain-containing protein [Archaeoglobus sp.]
MDFSDTVVKNAVKIVDFLKAFPKVLENQRERLNEFVRILKDSKAVHVYGVGRSGAVALCFAIRLKHFEKVLGCKVWWVGDEVRERIEAGDTLIAFSGSGETAEVLIVAERAKDANAKVVAITSFEDSSLAKIADLVIIIPGGLEKGKGWKYLEAQFGGEFYGGGEFEILAYIFQEVLISSVGEFFGIPKNVVIKEHERDSIRKKPSS